jgi:capsular exopolysaccharide synthesis family protein
VLQENSNAVHAEAFRNLRAAVSMLGRADDRRVFLFTSALPQEGKTFCSVNFAVSLSQQGLQTLLIDGDLRRPNVEMAMLGIRKSTIGVTDYLAGQRELTELINKTGYNDLSYLGVGSHAPNPSELLAQGRFAKLLQDALKRFDRIVIDSAPIQAVSDTLLILEGVQTVCLTIRSGRTPRKAVLRSLHTLKNAGAPLAGVVLNFLKRQRDGGGYYYNYDYSYQGKNVAAPQEVDEPQVKVASR